MADWVFILLLGGLAFWFWSNSLQAREAALRAGRNACRQMDVQLLDETVSLTRMGVARNIAGRMTLRRIYEFEFSIQGVERRRGRVILRGLAVESVQLDQPEGTTLVTPRSQR